MIVSLQADGSITGYEDSIAMHLTRMLSSNHYDVVLQSARLEHFCYLWYIYAS